MAAEDILDRIAGSVHSLADQMDEDVHKLRKLFGGLGTEEHVRKMTDALLMVASVAHDLAEEVSKAESRGAPIPRNIMERAERLEAARRLLSEEYGQYAERGVPFLSSNIEIKPIGGGQVGVFRGGELLSKFPTMGQAKDFVERGGK